MASWTGSMGGRGARIRLVCQRVQYRVNAERVAVRPKIQEVGRVIPFALERITEVRVVRHQDDDTSLLVSDGARMRGGAVSATLRSPVGAEEEIDRRDLRNLLHLELRVEHGVVERYVEDRELGGRQRL